MVASMVLIILSLGSVSLNAMEAERHSIDNPQVDNPQVIGTIDIQSCNIQPYLESKKTRTLIGMFQKIWRENYENLKKEGILHQSDNVSYVVNHVTKPKPSDIIADQDVLGIVDLIIANQTYCQLHQTAEALTKEKKEQQAKAAWAACRYHVSTLCKDQLKSKNVEFDIREQEEEPYYDVTFDPSKQDEQNRFMLTNNKDINSPTEVVPYMKAGFIITAIELQKGAPVLLTYLQRFGLTCKALAHRE